jgi:shikimate dehydrogenase
MAKEWNFLQDLVFNFGAELASNPTQYMMEQCFRDRGLNWRYVQFEFGPEKLEEAVHAMRLLGFHGGNCTMPYKVEITKHLDALGKSAEVMGAVNTVVRRGDKLVGENTDGKGFLQSFRSVADPAGKAVAILGAGGAARAIAVELALAGAPRFVVVNRSEKRGQELAELLRGKVGADAGYEPWQEDYKVPADIDVVVNATSIGMGDREARVAIDVESLRSDLVVADVVISPPDTWLIRTARERGATAIDGLGMVIHQAVIAFNYWTGEEADPQVMRVALEEVLGLEG